MDKTQKLYIFGGIAVAIALFIYTRKGVASSVGSSIGSAAVDTVTGAATGAVVAAGQAVGVPATDTAKCEAACAAGNTFDASLYCPAPRFIQYMVNGK